jgi:hypothetical protein
MGVAVTIYRPGSVAVVRNFFVEFNDVFTKLVTFLDRVLISGDFSVQADQVDDLSARQRNNLRATFGMVCHVTLPTQGIRGLLDVVIARADLQILPVDIIEIAISVHRLRQLRTPSGRSVPAR